MIDFYGLASLNLHERGTSNYYNGEAINIPGVFTVSGHGNPRAMQNRIFPIDAKQLAEKIKESPDYTPGMPVYLLGCNTGVKISPDTLAFGEEVAAELALLNKGEKKQSTVSAPDNFVWTYPSGDYKIAPINGHPNVTWENSWELSRGQIKKAGPNLTKQGGLVEFKP